MIPTRPLNPQPDSDENRQGEDPCDIADLVADDEDAIIVGPNGVVGGRGRYLGIEKKGVLP